MASTIFSSVDYELVIKKSRFIACIQPVADRASAQAVVQQLWAQHPDATHICWALLAGGQSAAVDDGEPSGTAGRPMLEVLRHHDLEGVLATVVRYFGGVKLGAGGLVRAYTDAVAQALQADDGADTGRRQAGDRGARDGASRRHEVAHGRPRHPVADQFAAAHPHRGLEHTFANQISQ